jgi:hypothetical protein
VLIMSKPRLLVIMSVLALTACGSSPAASGERVATLASGGPATTPASAPPAAEAGRPQLRLDTSDEERNRMFAAYDDCLVKNGVKVNTGDQAGPVTNELPDGRPGRVLDQSGEPRSAYRACAGKLPLQPPELDEEKNPRYAQQWNDNVKCLRAHGLMVHVTKPGEWTYDSADTPLPDNQEEIEDACMLEAFGAGE